MCPIPNLLEGFTKWDFMRYISLIDREKILNYCIIEITAMVIRIKEVLVKHKTKL